MNKFVSWKAPEGALLSHSVFVTCGGTPVDVYKTAVNPIHRFSPDPVCETTPVVCFDFDGTIEVSVCYSNILIDSAVIRPLKYNVNTVIAGDRVTFTLCTQGCYCLEINGNTGLALHIFTNKPENDIPDPTSDDIIYLGPGIHKGKIEAKSNQTVYLAGGAVLMGQILACGVENVTIRGRGIIDGSCFKVWLDRCGPRNINQVIADTSCNINIRDLILLDANAWVLNSFNTSNMEISNIKIISARSNGDGITLQSCMNVHVHDCFVRSWDDSLVVKNYGGNTGNLLFENCVLWTDLAQSMEIGYETNKGRRCHSEISNVVFRDITVLHNFHKPVLSIHNADDCHVHDITYENITLEDSRMGLGDAGTNNQLIDIIIAENRSWSSTKSRGNVSGIRYKNISVLSGVFPPSRFSGYDIEHRISDIVIENLEIFGKKIADFEEGLFDINEFCDNIKLI